MAKLGARLRGIVVAFVAALSLLVLHDSTPLGPLTRMAVNAARGTAYSGPSPLASYRGEDGRTYAFLLPPDDRSLQTITSTSRCLPAEQLEPIAAAREVDAVHLAALLDAHAEVQGEPPDQVCTVALPAEMEARAVAALPAGTHRMALRGDPQLAARGLARLLEIERRHFTDPASAHELALESLLVGRRDVQAATAAARAAGLPHAEDFDVHRALLPAAGAKRADRAVPVLARARLARMRWPADPRFRISSPFGERIHPTLKTRKFHNGVDIATPIGTPLYAVLDGRVSRASADRVSGNYLRVDHGLGIEAVYCHLHRAEKRPPDAVDLGDVVAKSGNTGRSTGPHLHFSLRLFGRAVDPLAHVVLPPKN